MESRSAPQSTIIGEETPSLPEQLIIEEILPRLPAKSLLKFRCVSKPWCSLIDSKRFIKDHLKRSIKRSRFPINCIYVDYAGTKCKQYSLPSILDKLFVHPNSHIADLGIDEYDMIEPVGCCNGLVCILVNWERFILWNPTTKMFNNLPYFYNQVKCGLFRIYGFGFDEFSDDYKVFGTVNRLDARSNIGMIYSLRSNSWKHIEKSEISPFCDKGVGMGMHVSGKLHWNSHEGYIVSFDLNRHASGVVELPSYTNGVFHSMGVLGGCISVHFFHPNGDLDVWVMKKYGVKESWDKLVTLPFYIMHLDIPSPVAAAPNCEVILISNSNIVFYSLKCDVLRHPQMSAFDDGVASVRSLGIHIESLVSVAPDSQ